MKRSQISIAIAGLLAGAVNGLMGAGGGMLLVPLLTRSAQLTPKEVFPSSVSVILPVCLVSLLVTAATTGLDPAGALPYLSGSFLGGILAGLFGKKIPVQWLHRVLGIMILWGGIRYLC